MASIKCISCREIFTNPEEQRLHYKTEYHRFNLKRKVAQLPPISKEAFEKKLEDIRLEEQEQSRDHGFSHHCPSCNKQFSSQSTYDQHLKSKKHQEKSTTYTPQEKMPVSLIQEPVADLLALEETSFEPKTEEQLLEEKLSNGFRFSLHQCMFCRFESADLESNLKHMTHFHGFFIPDIEYLTDLEGLIRYLGEKISIGNNCIYCNKAFLSLEAVQAHMTSVNHCKLLYEQETSEYDDFYDFTESYGTVVVDEKQDEEAIMEQIEKTNSIKILDNGELMVKDGKIVGNRSLAPFYKQKYRPPETRDAVLINSLMAQYRMLGWHTSGGQITTSGIKYQRKQQQYDQMKLGVQGNMLQKHYRAQVDF